MSLDITLTIGDKEVYHRNITHNLSKMARQAGIYRLLWRPEEINITKALEIIEPLTRGVILLVTEKAKFEAYNPPNGWGTWEQLLIFCASYLQACKDYPEATIEACR